MKNKITVSVLMAMAVSFVLHAVAGDVPVFNGDFEQSSPATPPPGWTMWGDQKWKIASNYTRDTDRPHGGQASFRIVHPKGTQGYIVTNPDRALQSKPGMAYTFSFFARGGHDGAGRFSLTAYQSLKTYLDAPSPGSWTVPLTKDWKKYSFTIHEGLDFFAGEASYILLTFKATSDTDTAQTMWVDDITIDESPNPAGTVQLIDPSTLKKKPAEAMLAVGDKLDITIDAERILKPVNPLVGGMSFHRLDGHSGYPFDKKGKYVMPEETAGAIRELRLPMTRLYGVGDGPWSVEESIDRAAELCQKTGIPTAHVILELEIESASKSLPPDIWARAVKRSVEKNYGFRHWEVGNEVYAPALWGSKAGMAYATPDEYAKHVAAVSKAVRDVQPDARIGLSISDHSLVWGSYLLRIAAGSYDFVCPHFYAGVDLNKPLETIVIETNKTMMERIETLKALLAAYNPNRAVTILDSEWALYGACPGDKEPEVNERNRNIISILHRAVRMIGYVQNNPLEGASGWELLGNPGYPGYGILYPAQPNKRSINYMFYRLWNSQIGSSVLEIKGSAPASTASLATLSADKKKVSVVLVNASADKAVSATLKLNAGAATAVMLSQPSLDSLAYDASTNEPKPLPTTVRDNTVTLELPAKAVVFVSVDLAR